MTRITPTFSADMAHYYHRPRGDEARRAKDSFETVESGSSRHYGNRRMGDRRTNDRRAHGRRAADRTHRHASGSWCSPQLGAHLIGQWIDRAPMPASKAVAAYGAPAQAKSKRGEVA